MLKKNTRKRLLAGALATVMMLTMCPSWALADNLADDEGIATLPANEEIAVPVDDSTPAADPTKTPADPTPSEPEAKPAEGQDPAPAPSEGGANGGTDSTESGNSTNPTIPEGSGNISQKNDVVSNPPENEISLQETPIDLAWNWQPEAKYFVLLPKCGTPDDNHDQGQVNYLPSSYDPDTGTQGSDGGVSGLDASKGYPGSITAKAKRILDRRGAIDGFDNENGLNDIGYLNVPDDLGFFTASNWNDDGTYKAEKNSNTDENTRRSLLDINGFEFHPDRVEIVWYTIKDQSKWVKDKYGIQHWVEDIHVDGYLRGVPITVTYHTNYANNGITGMDEKYMVDDNHVLSGYQYTAKNITDPVFTDFTPSDNYTFGGWYNDQACTDPYTPTTLITNKDLYAKWVQNKFDVTYYVDGEKQDDATEKHAVGDNVTVSTTVPTKEGYTFTGWTTDDVTVKNGTFTMPKNDVRFDAEFEINKHNVTY